MAQYTEKAQEALVLASEAAEDMGSPVIGTEHILVGLIEEGSGTAAMVLEANEVKLDRPLVGNFLFNSLSRSVIERVVGICAKNNVKCVAEGVESEAHAKGLLELGCIFAQGYYYGKPAPVADFSKKYLK